MLQTESGDSGWTSKLNPWNKKLTIQKYGTVVYKLYNSKLNQVDGMVDLNIDYIDYIIKLHWLGLVCLSDGSFALKDMNDLADPDHSSGRSWIHHDTPSSFSQSISKLACYGLLWPNSSNNQRSSGSSGSRTRASRVTKSRGFGWKNSRNLWPPRSLFGIWAPRRDVSLRSWVFFWEMGLSMTLDQLLKSHFSHVDRETMRNGWILGHLFQSGWRRVRALLRFINTTTIKHRSLQSSHVPDSETLVEGTCKVQSPFKHRMTNSSNYHRKLVPFTSLFRGGKIHGETWWVSWWNSAVEVPIPTRSCPPRAA